MLVSQTRNNWQLSVGSQAAMCILLATAGEGDIPQQCLPCLLPPQSAPTPPLGIDAGQCNRGGSSGLPRHGMHTAAPAFRPCSCRQCSSAGQRHGRGSGQGRARQPPAVRRTAGELSWLWLPSDLSGRPHVAGHTSNLGCPVMLAGVARPCCREGPRMRGGSCADCVQCMVGRAGISRNTCRQMSVHPPALPATPPHSYGRRMARQRAARRRRLEWRLRRWTTAWLRVRSVGRGSFY